MTFTNLSPLASTTARISDSTKAKLPDLRAPTLITISISSAPFWIASLVSKAFTAEVVAPKGNLLLYKSWHLYLQANLWLILMARKKSWVSCLLSIQVSVQLKRVVLMKNWLDWIIQLSWLFQWTSLLPKNVGAVLRYWKCHHALRLFRPILWTWLRPLNQWMASPSTRGLCSRYCNTIRYVEYVDNINSEPNFEAAIEAAKSLD